MSHKPAGLDLPNAFAAEDHLAIHNRMTLLASRFPGDNRNIRHVFSSAWIGVAHRLYAVAEYDDDFRKAIATGSAPPPPERYRQERALFGCTASSLSALECFYMGAYAVGSVKGAKSFPLTDRKHLKKYPDEVAKAFERDYSGDQFTFEARSVIGSPDYEQLCELRDVLAHRGVLPRQHIEDVGEGRFESSNFASSPVDWRALLAERTKHWRTG
jgi:hypothetical protein